LVYNSNGDGRLYSTVLDDKTINSNSSQFVAENTPYIFDSQSIDHERFVTLFADETTGQNATSKMYIIMGRIPEDDNIIFDNPHLIAENAPLPGQDSSQQFAYMAVLPNDRYSIMYHTQTKDGIGCMNYLIRYFNSNQTWETLDSNSLMSPCRSGNISPLVDSRAVIATEIDIRVMEYGNDKIQTISPVVKFTCRPSYLQIAGTESVTSQIDVEATSPHGFLLSCTWFKSAAVLYGVVRYSNENKIELGQFAEFDNVIPGTVKLSGAVEKSKDSKYSVFATYRSQSTGQYQTIRCGAIETYKGFFVSFSKPYVHMTYAPVDNIAYRNGSKFTAPVDIAGVSQYGVLFISTSKPQSGANGVFDLELAKWNGGNHFQ
jgi:hypothetical protein